VARRRILKIRGLAAIRTATLAMAPVLRVHGLRGYPRHSEFSHAR